MGAGSPVIIHDNCISCPCETVTELSVATAEADTIIITIIIIIIVYSTIQTIEIYDNIVVNMARYSTSTIHVLSGAHEKKFFFHGLLVLYYYSFRIQQYKWSTVILAVSISQLWQVS